MEQILEYTPILSLVAAVVVLYITELICISTLQFGVTGFFVVFGVLPLIFRFSLSVQKSFIFLNFIQWPWRYELINPEKFGLQGSRNLYVKSHSKVNNRTVSLGVWHILPSVYKNWSSYAELSLDSSEQQGETSMTDIRDKIFDSLLVKGGRPIILYVHGNTNNRACFQRVGLYKILQELNCHIIAFDYRSYGDSTRMRLTEMGVVEDAVIVYNWILEKYAQVGGNINPRVFFWGHSLGTGISNHALALLANRGLESGLEMPKINIEPSGVILECPFNNFYEELQGHILAKIYSWTPWFHWSIVDPVVSSGLRFESDRYIGMYPCPVLILHAQEDKVVPYELGVKLYDAALSTRPEGSGEVLMVSFPSKDSLGHKNIFMAKELPEIIGDFIANNFKSHLLTNPPLRPSTSTSSSSDLRT